MRSGPHSWDKEIRRLAKSLIKTYNVSTKTSFDRPKVLKEAISDCVNLDSYIVAATFDSLDVDGEVWLREMIAEYLPDLPT